MLSVSRFYRQRSKINASQANQISATLQREKEENIHVSALPLVKEPTDLGVFRQVICIHVYNHRNILVYIHNRMFLVVCRLSCRLVFIYTFFPVTLQNQCQQNNKIGDTILDRAWILSNNSVTTEVQIITEVLI